MFAWFRNRLRRRLLAQPFPAGWERHLDENVHHFAYLSSAEQARLRRRVQVFVGEKNWVGCGGLIVDDEVRVTIASQACLLLLGWDEAYCFDGVRSVLVYPGPYAQPGSQRGQQWLASDVSPMQGEAWHRGPIVLSWEHALLGGREAPQGRNLVLHEFAHHLDGLDGDMDGIPPLPGAEDYRRWNDVTTREYQRLCSAAHQDRVTLLDQYGATNPAEFFAVSTECFFERPAAMLQRHADLYDVLRQFYRQDPAAWYTSARARAAELAGQGVCPAHVLEARYEESVRQCVRDMRLRPGTADVPFAAGVIHAQNGRHERAIASFSEALTLDPHDPEIYIDRAAALLELGDVAAALADCEQALEIDPLDVEAHRQRGRVYLRRGDYDCAIGDFTAVLERDRRDADAYYQRGLAWASSGQFQQAVADYGQAIRYAPDKAEYYAARSHALHQLGRSQEADADRDEALRRDPDLANEPGSDSFH